MIEQIKPENILFLDIETVPVKYKYNELNDTERSLWDTKTRFMQREDITSEVLYQKAGIYAEFGKIVCISTGIIFKEKNRRIRIKSFYGDDEKQLLTEFAALLNEHFNTDRHFLCAHNGKEFDFPFLCRRMLINQIKLPKMLNVHGRKPWEVNFLDTMELWKFGDYKNFTSLELLTSVFGIDSPKDDIKGEDVKRVYYEDKDLKRIAHYCKKDVLAIAQLFLKYRCENIIPPEDVIFVD